MPGTDFQCRCSMVMWDPEIDGKYEVKEQESIEENKNEIVAKSEKNAKNEIHELRSKNLSLEKKLRRLENNPFLKQQKEKAVKSIKTIAKSVDENLSIEVLNGVSKKLVPLIEKFKLPAFEKIESTSVDYRYLGFSQDGKNFYINDDLMHYLFTDKNARKEFFENNVSRLQSTL